MNTGRSNHTSVGRTLERAALAIALAAAFVAGSWISPSLGPEARKPRERVTPRGTQNVWSQFREIESDDPLAYAAQPAIPSQAAPRAVAARAAVIRRTAEAIQAECRLAAADDWEKWQRDTEPYRNALQAKVEALKKLEKGGTSYPEGRFEALEGRDGFPLFETAAHMHVNYLYKPESLDGFARDRPVVAANRWLRRQGIDLIFVPVPRMTEVYVEHFLDPCPPDGIIAPHVRRTLLELLKADVEIVDGLPLFRSMRDPGAEYLYNTADPHWAPRGMRVMAKTVADRIARYRFGARARYALPIVTTKPAPYLPPNGFQTGLPALTADQRERAEFAETVEDSGVCMEDGRTPPTDASSPVLLIGHSYVPGFREHLVKELNLLVATRAFPAATTEFFADFLRDPETLARTRVVVWVTTEQQLAEFRPMPGPILQTSDPGKTVRRGTEEGRGTSRPENGHPPGKSP
jgi:hypothetical protein